MGPGPPPRRAKRSNTANSSQKGVVALGSRSTVASRAGSSAEVCRRDLSLRLSKDTLNDENWNRRRYQREDEELWGFGESHSPPDTAVARGSSVGVGGASRPNTDKSSAESAYTTRAPVAATNPLQPPFVGLPSVRPTDNHWMLQPPPRASVMSGKERATKRSRSGSGASSRVELSLQRQASTRYLRQKLERGTSPELPPLSRGSSYHNNLIAAQRHDRPGTPQSRPASSNSSRKPRKGRDTAIGDASELSTISRESSNTVVHAECKPSTPVPASNGSNEAVEAPLRASTPNASPKTLPVPNLKIVRVRSSLQRLSTIVSSDSVNPTSPDQRRPHHGMENRRSSKNQRSSTTQSSDSTPYMMVRHRTPLGSSDLSSLNMLQDLVPPRDLLSSRFVSSPLPEARIRLPPSDYEEEHTLWPGDAWPGSGFGVSREWLAAADESPHHSNCLHVPERDPRMRWSVDF
jgi:hypothetical protein